WGNRVVKEIRAMAGTPHNPEPEPPPLTRGRADAPRPLALTPKSRDVRLFNGLAAAQAGEKRDIIDHFAGPFRRHHLLAPIVGMVLLVGIVGDFASGLGVL